MPTDGRSESILRFGRILVVYLFFVRRCVSFEEPAYRHTLRFGLFTSIGVVHSVTHSHSIHVDERRFYLYTHSREFAVYFHCMRCTTVYDLVLDSRNVGRAKRDESSVLNSKFKIENQETTSMKTDWVSITRDGPMICICRCILTRARQSLTSTSLSLRCRVA